jgi:hypothetical protein
MSLPLQQPQTFSNESSVKRAPFIAYNNYPYYASEVVNMDHAVPPPVGFPPNDPYLPINAPVPTASPSLRPVVARRHTHYLPQGQPQYARRSPSLFGYQRPQ